MMTLSFGSFSSLIGDVVGKSYRLLVSNHPTRDCITQTKLFSVFTVSNGAIIDGDLVFNYLLLAARKCVSGPTSGGFQHRLVSVSFLMGM